MVSDSAKLLKLPKPPLEQVSVVLQNQPFPTETFETGFRQKMKSFWNYEQTETDFSPGKTPLGYRWPCYITA